MSGSGEAGDLAHLVHRVQGGELVGLGQGRVAEDGVDQVVDGAAAAHDDLVVYALGLGDDLAGVTFECNEPPARAGLAIGADSAIATAYIAEYAPKSRRGSLSLLQQ